MTFMEICLFLARYNFCKALHFAKVRDHVITVLPGSRLHGRVGLVQYNCANRGTKPWNLQFATIFLKWFGAIQHADYMHSTY